MSSVSSATSNMLSNSSDIYGAQKRQRPDSAKMAEDLFAQLDTTGKGYIEQSDLASALSNLNSSSSGTASADDIFSQLDGDSDGKVTKDELSASLERLSESLDNQFNQMRMKDAMPPSPPAGESKSDEGFTKDELTSQLADIGSDDSARSSLIGDVVENFDAADTNSDGKVSFSEAMAYEQNNSSSTGSKLSTTSGSVTDTATGAGSDVTDARVLRQLMELLHAYGAGSDTGQNATASQLSVTA